ncbi:MAG: amidohydrolase family protein [Adhaeribacter sp.]
MNRRKFFTRTALSAAGLMVADKLLAGEGSAPSPAGAAPRPAAGTLMEQVLKFRKIDAHVHVNLGTSNMAEQQKMAAVLLDYADRFGVEKLMLSKPVTRLNQGIPDGTVAAYRDHNDVVLAVMKMHPGRFAGNFTLNPLDRQAALDEIDRRMDQGMSGAKLYYQVKISDPIYAPVLEKLISRKVVIHSHAECQIGVGGYRMKYDGRKPKNVSIPEDFVEVARRYPEGIFQYAHIGGGGDWEYMCKMLKNSPNVYVDTSGSNNEEHLIDFAVRQLGVERLLFGSDNCYYQAIGKVMASNLSEDEKRKIFFENYNNLLSKSGQHVN